LRYCALRAALAEAIRSACGLAVIGSPWAVVKPRTKVRPKSQRPRCTRSPCSAMTTRQLVVLALKACSPGW